MYTQAWKVTIGKGYASGVDLLKMLRRHETEVNHRGRKILSDICYNVCTSPREIKLVRITPRRLGCTGSTLYKGEFYCRVERSGLKEVHADTGVMLRLAIQKQREKDNLFIGMSPIPHPENNLKAYVFHLSSCASGVLRFDAVPMSYNTSIDIDDTFIFCG